MKDTLKTMLVEFFIILSGTTICSAIFCTVFYRDVTLGVDFLWELIALSFLTTLPQLLFCSKKEFTRKQMMIRQSIHIILVVGLIVCLACIWRWIRFSTFIEPVAFVMLVLLSYAGITSFMYYREKKLAETLNEKLREFKDRKEE
jgi:hypothetical protein